MKKILSLALVTSLMLGTVAVKAQTQTTDLVKLYDFNSLTAGTIDDAGLSALGITASTDGNAEMSIVDLSEDETHSSMGQVLSYKATSAASEDGAQTTSIVFPMSYNLNDDEKLVIEYDFLGVNTATTRDEVFGSAEWGYSGIIPVSITNGGVGKVFQLYDRTSTFSSYRLGIGWWSTDSAKYYQGNSTWFHVKQVFDVAEYKADNTKGASLTVVNAKTGGTLSGGCVDKIGPISASTVDSTLTGLTFDNTNGTGQVYLDNIHVYTMPKFKLSDSSIEDGAQNVFYDTKEINLSFSNTIADASAVTVSKDGAQMPEGSYSVTPSENSVVITFADDLSYSSSYTVSLTGITDTLGQVLGEETISFTVEAEPDIRLGELKLTKGIGNSLETVSEFAAANGLQTISLELENLKEEAKNVNVIFAIFEGENRRLSAVKNVEASIPANETRTLSIGTDMTDMQGKIVKAFVWESYSSMTPWFGCTELEVK